MKSAATLRPVHRWLLCALALSLVQAVLEGAGNFFPGLLYSATRVQARNLTVLGKMMVNSADPRQGAATLDHVKVVSTASASAVSVTSRSSSMARSQEATGSLPFSFGGSTNAGPGSFWIGIPTVNGGGYTGWYARADCTVENILARWDTADAIPRTKYQARVRALAEGYVDYYQRHADKDGRYNTGGKPIDVAKSYRIDMNQFLPRASDRLKVKFWHVYHRRL